MASFIAPSGREWSYTIAGDEQKARQTIILLHGWSMSCASFKPLATYLADQFTIYNFDLPGHGNSPAVDDARVAGFAEDVASFIAQHVIDLPDDLPVEGRPLIAGWSLGGQIALHLAATRPELLTGVVLLATTPKFVRSSDWPHGQNATQVKFMIRGMGRNAQATIDAFRRPIAEVPEYAAIYADNPTYPDSRVAADLLQELIDIDLRDQLGQIDLPALIIHGRDDLIIPKAVGEYLAEQLPCSSLVLLEGGHAPHLVEPASVANTIFQWSEGVLCR